MTLEILVMWTIPTACDYGSYGGQQITKLSMY